MRDLERWHSVGIIQKIKDYRIKKRLGRLEADLQMIRNRINFDPRYVYGLDDLDSSEAYTRRLEEYRIWFTGDKRLLRKLYKNNIKEDSYNYFWYKAPPTARLLHSGIPGLISTKMATILFGGGYDAEVTVYKEDSEDKDEVKSKQAQELLDNLLTILNVDERLENGAENESWGGGVFMKFSHKVSLSNYPILEVANVTKAEAVIERGILVGVIFKYWHTYKKKQYRIDEVYTTNDDGDAIIRYELYELQSRGEEKQVELETIPEGYDLKFTSDGTPRLNDNDEFVYTGIKGMLAFYKPNKTPSHEFMDTYYGASDYEGALDSYDALDEAYSELIQELRDNKTIRYIPENMIPTITVYPTNGEPFTEPMLPDEFVTNYVKVAGDADQDAKNEITIKQIDDKTEDHLKKWRIALTTAINKAGVSPLALGITGLEAVNSSSESQQERNKATLETRAKKLKIWIPFMKDVFMKMLELNSWMQKNTNANQDAFAKLDLNFDNLDINITFGDYIVSKQEEKIITWGGAKSQGVASIETVVDKIHPEWTEAQKLEEVQRIKFENSITMDTPESLQVNDLLTPPKENEPIDDVG